MSRFAIYYNHTLLGIISKYEVKRRPEAELEHDDHCGHLAHFEDPIDEIDRLDALKIMNELLTKANASEAAKKYLLKFDSLTTIANDYDVQPHILRKEIEEILRRCRDPYVV